MRRIEIVVVLMVVVLGIVFSKSFADVPRMINFQGRLTDANNNPLNGTYDNMTFRIYNTPSGGTSLWSETRSVSVSNGLFSVTLGEVTPIPIALFDGTTKYLAIDIDGAGSEPEMSPRLKIVSSGHAFISERAFGVIGSTITSANIVDGTIINEDISPTANISPSKLGSGSLPATVIASSIAVNSVHTDAIQSGAVTDAKITGQISGSKIGSGISPSNIAAGSLPNNVIASSIAVNSVHTDAIQSGAVTDAKITGPISGSKIGSGISPSNIAAGSLPNNVIASSIAVNSVHTDAIQGSAVTSAKIADGTITKDDIASNACSYMVFASSAGERWIDTTNDTWVDLPGKDQNNSGTVLQVSNFTTQGNPVIIMYSVKNRPYTTNDSVQFRALRDTTEISGSVAETKINADRYVNTTHFCVDSPSAGTYTYKLQIKYAGTGGTPDIYVWDSNLIVIELRR